MTDPTDRPPLPDPAWSRMPGEPSRAFYAFACYLECGEFRTLDQVGRKLYPGSGTRKRGATGRVFEWSRRWRWVERAAAFDQPAYMDKLAEIRARQRAERERRFSYA